MALSAEVSSLRLRAKSLAIGTAFNYLYAMFWSIVLPYLFNNDQANLGGKVGFVFAGTGVLFWAIVWWDAPETRGRTFEEIDEMFEMKVPARKFEKHVIETRTVP
jgi:SP family general alpha glucoside:H+ symporter-like MFS transporter